MNTADAAWDTLDQKVKDRMAKIRNKILVLSNKGGVGKSTVAANLAMALASSGKKVGILDADIHGPSMMKMFGLEGRRLSDDASGLKPIAARPGIKLVSMGALLEDEDKPVIWRGPMKSKVLKEFLGTVEWGSLDCLVIDSPPGTGDEPLSICQLLPELTGAVIVTTPQEMALLDSRKCVALLRQLRIPILGLVENMSGFECPHCSGAIDLLKTGGGQRASRELGVPMLGRIPFELSIVDCGDSGTPLLQSHQSSAAVEALLSVAVKVLEACEETVGAADPRENRDS